MYTFRARLNISGKPVDERSVKTGIRSLVVRRDNDEWGQSFAFVVNGVPVFGKGANWIPADSFPTRVTADSVSLATRIGCGCEHEHAPSLGWRHI
jgi:beta-mannosidase